MFLTVLATILFYFYKTIHKYNPNIFNRMWNTTLDVVKGIQLIRYEFYRTYPLYLLKNHREKLLHPELDSISFYLKEKIEKELLKTHKECLLWFEDYKIYLDNPDDLYLRDYLAYYLGFFEEVITIYQSNTEMSIELIDQCIEILDSAVYIEKH